MFSVKMETEQRFHNSNKRYDIERRIFYSCDNQVLIVLVAAISLVTGKKPKIRLPYVLRETSPAKLQPNRFATF